MFSGLYKFSDWRINTKVHRVGFRRVSSVSWSAWELLWRRMSMTMSSEIIKRIEKNMNHPGWYCSSHVARRTKIKVFRCHTYNTMKDMGTFSPFSRMANDVTSNRWVYIYINIYIYIIWLTSRTVCIILIWEGVERQQFLDLRKCASESSGVSIRTHAAGKIRCSWALGVRRADTSEISWFWNCCIKILEEDV